MEPLKLLSLGAIALAVSSCIVVYILHRRTTARLDALTQANMGITHTLHQLVASSMPRPQSQLQPQSQTELVPTGGDNAVTQLSDSVEETKNVAGTGRIIVSDDENSGSDSSELTNMCSGSEDDDSGSESDNEGSSVEIEGENIDKEEVITQEATLVTKRVEELSDDEGDDESDIESSDVSEDEGDGESDDSDDEEGKIALTGGDVAIESDNIDELPVQETPPADVSGNNVDLVAFLLPQTDDKSIDIGIMPVSSSKKGLSPYENDKPIPDSFKQMKVEELRKLIVSKLGMSDDEAKKLKKPQLIQKLSESHE